MTAKKTNAELLQQAREAEFEYCRNNPLYWVNNYCPIEDKDSPEVIVPFTAWQAQEELLKGLLDNRLNIILKARQLGVTWLALYVCAHDLIFNSGHLVIALSKTETEAIELVRRMKVILAYQPEILAGGGLTYEGTSTIVRITAAKGLVSVFQSFASSESTARSFTANILLLDEWAYQQWAREIWTSAYPTINRPTGGKVIGLSTIKRGTLFEELFTADNNFKKYFLSVFADPRRSQEWYEQSAKDLGQLIKQEYPRTIEEALSNIGGAFYPEFSESVHVIAPFDIPQHWKRYSAIDYGLDKLAYGLFAVDTEGKSYMVGEIHESGLVVSEACKRIDDLIKQVGWQDGRITELAPPDLWNRSTQTGISTADEFSKHGRYLVSVNNNIEHGCLAVKEQLKVYTDNDNPTARLKIFKRCPVAIRYIQDILTDEKDARIYAKQPHEYTHINDMLRYYAVFWRSTAKEPEQAKPKRAIDILKLQHARRVV